MFTTSKIAGKKLTSQAAAAINASDGLLLQKSQSVQKIATVCCHQ
jgi:hypothetical protein